DAPHFVIAPALLVLQVSRRQFLAAMTANLGAVHLRDFAQAVARLLEKSACFRLLVLRLSRRAVGRLHQRFQALQLGAQLLAACLDLRQLLFRRLLALLRLPQTVAVLLKARQLRDKLHERGEFLVYRSRSLRFLTGLGWKRSEFLSDRFEFGGLS